jgi:hypothetical protein
MTSAALTSEAAPAKSGSAERVRSASLSWLFLAIASLTLGSFAFGTERLADGRSLGRSAWRHVAGRVGGLTRKLWQGRHDHVSVGSASTAIATLRADLHDGPAQHLAYALMHLDELEPRDAPEGDRRREVYKKVEQAIRAALEETREIASGTSLPAIRKLDPATVIADAIRSHETRTQTSVEKQIAGLPAALAPSVKVCLYRFTQEGLNNAYRHAHGKGQKLTVRLAGNEIFAEVADEGPGAAEAGAKPDRLGLTGLRERVESAGGRLELVSLPGKGTKLVLRLPASKRGASE